MSAILHKEIEEVIKRILVSELKISATVLETINSTTPLLGRGIGLDSSETVALIVGIEEQFKISVPDSDLTADLFENIGTLTEYVFRNISTRPSSRNDGNSKPRT